MRLPVLTDAFARTVSYLRVSLTDRCNYRCLYCMPEEGVDLVPKSDVLTFEEVERIVRVMTGFGVRRVRLTGGEPTVRKDVVELVARLGRLGLEDLAMTTNGERLVELAAPLKRAGLTRLNVSIDTLDAEKFRAITRRGNLDKVLAGIDSARAAGFRNTKINAVVMGSVNDSDVPALCAWAWAREITPRFIESMPMSDGALFVPGSFVSAAQIRARVEAAFGALENDDASGLAGVGPARYQRVVAGAHAGARVGVISAVTEPFCATCNRVRLTATGQLHTCLALDDDTDLRVPLRAGASDEELARKVLNAVTAKKEGHSFTACGTGGPRKHMVAIGG
ncbi:MAG: molybdenum cofactor biosynthesis protein [Myxococcales bacterium]|nr:molybdenum cofactor biosynthesis protein [Myxococcales bacterium]